MTNGVEVDIGVGTIGILLKQYNHTNLNDMWMSILQIQMLKIEITKESKDLNKKSWSKKQ